MWEVRLARLAAEPDLPRLMERLAGLVRDGAVAPHAFLARAVLGLELSEAEAERVVRAIETDRVTLQRELGRDPGFVWAALDRLCRERDLPSSPVFAGDSSAARGGPAEADRSAPGLDVPLERELTRELARIRRHGDVASLLAVAVDNRCGEPAPKGAILERVERSMRFALRESDIVGRHAGAELHALLPRAGRLTASAAAERVRRVVGLGPGGSRRGEHGWLTVSVGIACVPQDADEPGAWVDRAREALSRARQEGGDRIVAHAGERRGQVRLPTAPRATGAVIRADGRTTAVRLIDVSADGLALDGLGGVGEQEIVRVRVGSTPPHVAAGRVVRHDLHTGRTAIALAEHLPRSLVDDLSGAAVRAVPPPGSGS